MSNNKANTIRSPQNVTSPPRQQQQQQRQQVESRPVLVPQNQLNKPTTIRSPPSATGQQKPVQGQQSILEMMRSPQKAQAQQPQQQVVNNNRQTNNVYLINISFLLLNILSERYIKSAFLTPKSVIFFLNLFLLDISFHLLKPC
jgi:hypothetical protein